MNIALWIVAGVLAVAYFFGGGGKLVISKRKLDGLAARLPTGSWLLDFDGGAVKAIGALEVLGAIGLILPAVLDIAPVLVPLAAVGLSLVMIGAVVLRIRRQEYRFMAFDLVYLVLLAFLAWGRFGPEPFTG